MSSALCTQHREKRYNVQRKNCSALAPLGPHSVSNKHLCARHLSHNSLYVPALIYWQAPNLSHTDGPKKKPLLLCTLCWSKQLQGKALKSRRNQFNLLIKDARLLCPCCTHGFANTAAFIEATEMVPSKLSLSGKWLCATTAVAGLFRKSLRSCELCDEGWVIA